MERSNKKSWYMNTVCVIVLLGIFTIAALILVNMGVQVYRNIVAENASNYRLRTSLSYVTTKMRQMDQEGSIQLEQREGVEVLVMNQRIDGTPYETLIYFYKGKLYELFHEQGGEFYLSDVRCGYEITEIAKFSMEEVNTRLMRFTAMDDSGREESVTVNMRSRR